MPRRKGAPTVPWKVLVDQTLALKVELRFVNPETKKPNYGARSKLINTLLANWQLRMEQHDAQALAQLSEALALSTEEQVS